VKTTTEAINAMRRVLATAIESSAGSEWNGEIGIEAVRETLGALIDAMVALSVAANIPRASLVLLVDQCMAEVDAHPGYAGALTTVAVEAAQFAARFRVDRPRG
jgi:hypothetical protein